MYVISKVGDRAVEGSAAVVPSPLHFLGSDPAQINEKLHRIDGLITD